MIPYFVAGGHWNYARDSIVNLRMSVSVLLSSNFKKINWPLTRLYTDVFTDNNKLISIKKLIASSHHNMTPTLIALHALSDYNSLPMMFTIGKSKALKAVSKIPLRYIGDVDANLEDVMQEGKQFIAIFYGRNQLSSSENRWAIWKNKTIDHSVQNVWNPPFISPLPYGHLPVFIFFPKPPFFARLFQQYCPNEIRDRHKSKLTWQSYLFIFKRLKNNVTCFFI